MQIPQRHNEAKDALDFAQKMAKQEMDSIERLHARTLRSLSMIAAGFVFCLGFFGWIGYSNLRDTAVDIAKSQMQKEVTRQVQDKLTTERINEIVKEQVSNYSKSTMEAAIQKDLRSEPLASEIRNAATTAASNIVAKKFAKRHLTDSQCRTFANAVASYDDLDGYPVNTMNNAINAEARDFIYDIERCIPQTRLKFYHGGGYSNSPFVDGLGLYYYEKSLKYAQHLQAAFQSVGIETRLMPQGALARPELGEKQPISIWAGNIEIK